MVQDGALIAQLASVDASQRRDAALELGRRKSRPAVPALIDLLKKDGNDVRVAPYVAAALADIGDRRCIDPLIAALREPISSGAAVEALAKLRDERAVEPLIRLFKNSPHASLATVLGRWGDPRAVEPLVAAMGHADPHLRFYSARALGRLGDKRALPCLERARDEDTAPIVDTKSLHGKTVSYAAAAAIDEILRRAGQPGSH